MDQGYSGSQAAEVVGITYRQLDYWARTDLIRPSSCDAKGSGTRRVYNYRNLLELRVNRGTHRDQWSVGCVVSRRSVGRRDARRTRRT